MSRDMKVIIGVDGSQDGEEAFDFYAKHFHAPNHEAILVYVVKPLVISSNEISLSVNDIRERSMIEEKKKVKSLKENYEEKMRNLGIRGKINIIYYSKKPGKIICELAHQEHCSMVVVGCIRTGKGSLGPTVDYVLRKSPCSVSVVRVGATGLPDSRSRHEVFRTSRSSKESDPRLRKISCPVVRSPLLGVEGETSGGGANGLSGPASKGASFLEVPRQPKQRRHSTVVNVFQNLSLQQTELKKRFHEELDENKG